MDAGKKVIRSNCGDLCLFQFDSFVILLKQGSAKDGKLLHAERSTYPKSSDIQTYNFTGAKGFWTGGPAWHTQVETKAE
jgi:hypothetical protein